MRALILVIGAVLSVAACTHDNKPKLQRTAIRDDLTYIDTVLGQDPHGKPVLIGGDAPIDTYYYENVMRLAQVEQIRPLVKKAMADNVITTDEYNGLITANEKLAEAEDNAAAQAELKRLKDSLK